MRIVSGVQPTNRLHLGNYLGAIKQWVIAQNTYESFFFIPDLHTLTSFDTDPSLRKDNVLKVVAAYIACGINPSKAVLFLQSAVHQHVQMHWVLSCCTQMGWLRKMTQFKDKKDSLGEHLGLFAYPVLMAADVLLYDASHVPVGHDQVQHIEIMRDIAECFNRRTNTSTFLIPEAIVGDAKRIMSLKDASTKMSKSDPSDHSRINLDDDADTIRAKIAKAKTDTLPLPESIEALSERDTVRNLYDIFAAMSDMSIGEIVNVFQGQQFSSFKKVLADLIIADITLIGAKISDLLKNKDYLYTVLSDGQQKASIIAEKKMQTVYGLLGI